MSCFGKWILAAICSAASLQAQVSLAFGDTFGVLLKGDGTVWSWDGDSKGLEQVPGLERMRNVAAGESSTLALKSDGTVWTREHSSAEPALVSGLSGIVAIAAAGRHFMALDSQGVVWGWGEVPNRSSVPTPTQVTGLPKIVAIGAGDQHSIAIDHSGQVWVWGDHGAGDLGDHCYNLSNVPQKMRGFTDMKAVAGGYQLTLGLKKDGTVWAIGYGAAGQMGNGKLDSSTNPVMVRGLTGVKAIAARYMNAIALKADGTVWGWGSNHYHELGNPAVGSEEVSKPVRAGTLTGAEAIASGGSHSAAVTGKGVVWTWGDNQNGALGADSEALERSDTPMQPGQEIPPPCQVLFACLTKGGKVIRICGTQDQSDPGKWTGIHYRYGPESGPPDFMFPAKPDTAPPSLFFSPDGAVRFSNGGYRYRVLDGVMVQDAKGKTVANISCDERPQMYFDYLKENLPAYRPATSLSR
jgi:alpha-tubulin suppressor-like RCC1 family protein